MQETRFQSLGSGRCPGEGNGNLLRYSCLENPMDRGARWATVHVAAESRMWLSTHTHTGNATPLLSHMATAAPAKSSQEWLLCWFYHWIHFLLFSRRQYRNRWLFKTAVSKTDKAESQEILGILQASFLATLCGFQILVLQPGIKPRSLVVEVQSPIHWTAREVPCKLLYSKFI